MAKSKTKARYDLTKINTRAPKELDKDEIKKEDHLHRPGAG